MEKVEEYIKKHTRNCSNEYLVDSKSDGLGGYISRRNFEPWLTPNNARRAAEIAREETIEEVCEWLKKNVTYIHPRKETTECVVNITRLKEDLGL